MGGFEYAKLLESMQEFGFTDPITVRRQGTGFQIIDGEHRWRAARDMGLLGIDYFEIDVDDDQAVRLSIILNELKGRHDPRKLGALLGDLLSGSSAEHVLKGMPFTEEALEGLVGLKNFDWSSVTPDPPKDKFTDPSPMKGKRWVERTFRLPPDANEVLSDALDKAKDDDEIEDWQALERIAAEFLAS